MRSHHRFYIVMTMSKVELRLLYLLLDSSLYFLHPLTTPTYGGLPFSKPTHPIKFGYPLWILFTFYLIKKFKIIFKLF